MLAATVRFPFTRAFSIWNSGQLAKLMTSAPRTGTMKP